jgi:hypothetical protein
MSLLNLRAIFQRTSFKPISVPSTSIRCFANANRTIQSKSKSSLPPLEFIHPQPSIQFPYQDFTPTLQQLTPWIKLEQPEITSVPWHPKAKRTGIVGQKCGMMQLWSKHGVRFAVTVIRVNENKIRIIFCTFIIFKHHGYKI